MEQTSKQKDDAVKEKAKPEVAIKQIKMKISCANPERAFYKGDICDVPGDVPIETATSWVKSGAASKVG